MFNVYLNLHHRDMEFCSASHTASTFTRCPFSYRALIIRSSSTFGGMRLSCIAWSGFQFRFRTLHSYREDLNLIGKPRIVGRTRKRGNRLIDWGAWKKGIPRVRKDDPTEISNLITSPLLRKGRFRVTIELLYGALFSMRRRFWNAPWKRPENPWKIRRCEEKWS